MKESTCSVDSYLEQRRSSISQVANRVAALWHFDAKHFGGGQLGRAGYSRERPNFSKALTQLRA